MTYNPRKNNKKTMFKKMTLGLTFLDTDKFNCEELIEILSTIPFGSININLNIAKEQLGLRGKGFTAIGFVNKFYTNEEGQYVFDVAVSNKYASQVENLVENDDEELAITARVFTNKEGKITKIIGLDVTPIIK